MAKKKSARSNPAKTKTIPTFELRFRAPQLDPEKVPLRAVSDALSAIQDLASGRDPFELQHVPPEKAIGLIDVRKGSAVYSCVSHAPEEALDNLAKVRLLLSGSSSDAQTDDGLVVMMRPIQSLSEVAKSLKCEVEVVVARKPLFAVRADDYQRLSKRLFISGETTVIGTVERVGGATGMRCLLRVPGRRRILYCDVQSKELVRRLGQHLYEEIVASGTATWIHRSWRIYKFTINDFSQPDLGDPNEAIKELRDAGLSAWDSIDDPEAFIRGLRA